MKTHYAHLTEEQRKPAYERAYEFVVKGLLEGPLLYKLDEDLRNNYEKACEKAEQLRTPWFAPEYITDDPKLKAWIEQEVKATLDRAIFLEPGELAFRI